MRTYYEIEMVRDERDVWVAPWELGQVRTAAKAQAASPSAEPAAGPAQKKHSWGEFLRDLLPHWKDEGAYCGQQAA